MSWRDDLEGFTTKQLLRMRDVAYRNGGIYRSHWFSRKGPLTWEDYNLEQIQEILFDREHVPNKKERKVIRRQELKAKQKRTKGAR